MVTCRSLSGRLSVAVVLLTLPLFLAAQDSPTEPDAPGDRSIVGTLSGPVMGFISDPGSGSFRPIYGAPGAALLGEPIDLPFEVEGAVVSPTQDFAVANIGGEHIPVVLLLKSDPR